jgi:excisionase family DNA binding protein
MNNYLTVMQAAEYLGYNMYTVYRWVEQGRIPYFNAFAGRKGIRLLRADLDHFMAGYRVPAIMEQDLDG